MTDCAWKKPDMIYKVWKWIDGQDHLYGKYENRDYANEIAMMIRDEQGIDTWVEECEYEDWGWKLP